MEVFILEVIPDVIAVEVAYTPMSAEFHISTSHRPSFSASLDGELTQVVW